MRAILFSVLTFATLAACGNTDRPLREMGVSDGGPDEFLVIPLNPLDVPASASLPMPTPGGTNRADQAPKATAIAVLGGNPSSQIAGGIPATEAALAAHTARYGVNPAIRAELAAADDAILRRKRISNVFNPLNRDRYFGAYANQALDAYAELARLAALGVQVPDAPVAE